MGEEENLFIPWHLISHCDTTGFTLLGILTCTIPSDWECEGTLPETFEPPPIPLKAYQFYRKLTLEPRLLHPLLQAIYACIVEYLKSITRIAPELQPCLLVELSKILIFYGIDLF